MFFFTYLKEILVGIVAVFTLFLLRRNKILTAKNNELQQNNTEKDKVINIQAKVLDASENTKSTDLDGNLERLCKQKDR